MCQIIIEEMKLASSGAQGPVHGDSLRNTVGCWCPGQACQLRAGTPGAGVAPSTTADGSCSLPVRVRDRSRTEKRETVRDRDGWNLTRHLCPGVEDSVWLLSRT